MKKKIIITALLALVAMTGQGQTRVILNPACDEQEGSIVHLVKVELTDTATILHLNLHCNFGGWSGTNNYIEANGKRYAFRSGRRIPTMDGKELKEDVEIPTLNKAGKTGALLIKGGEEPFVEGKHYTNTSQKDSLILHFEPLPADVTMFDVGDDIRNVSLVETKKEEFIADSHLLVMPDATPEQFFDAVAAMFPGKVVFIDLWATWCGPCKHGIIKMRSVKEELKSKDVVFVYLTNESSPEADWRSSIGSIKGYHLRMSSSFWNKLPCIIDCSGIPQYFLYDRNGKRVYHQVGFDDGSPLSFKEMILKALEEQ